MKSRIALSSLRKTFLPICRLVLACGGVLLCLPAAAQLRADFTANVTTGCSPVIVQFTDQSQGSPTSWKWDFGNGSSSVLQNPQASYTQPGSYTVTLTVSNTSGSTTVTKTAYITVYPSPVAGFSQSTTGGCYPLPVSFTNLSSTSTGNITNVLWDFGDGNTDTSANPSHTYVAPGNFNVSLIVTNNYGCRNGQTKFDAVTISSGVTAGFSAADTTSCTAPLAVNFTNSSSGSGTLGYQWDFGDGGSSTLANPTHIFTANGSFTVSLKVTNAGGCTSMIRKANFINIAAFKSDFNAPTGCVNEAVQFTNTSTPSPSAATWYFSDGTVITGINATRSFSVAGAYSVKLVNSFGACTGSVTKSFTISPNPRAEFSAVNTASCTAPLTVSFRDSSLNATAWSWDFGDGASSTLQNPSHIYTNAGSYSVKLVVTNAAGCTDSIVKNNFVNIQAPVVRFGSDVREGCVPLTVHFTPFVSSADPIVSYSWDFGDGTGSSQANPAHTYTKEGIYTVKLIITTAGGCTDSAVVAGAVRAGTKPVANFSGSPLTTCQMHPVYFTDSSPKADRWFWNFGDGQYSQQENPEHFYGAIGTFTVQLIASDKGCTDTLTRVNYVTILPPVAAFTVSRNCGNHFLVTVTDQSAGATHWLWNFGDGITDTLQHPSPHTYAKPGTYQIILRVDNDSCFSLDTATVAVVDEHPLLAADTNLVCRGTAVNFSALNIHPSNIVSYQWEPGDGSSLADTFSSFHKVYAQNGVYPARLIITDINGCTDTSNVDTIRVRGPVADFSAPNRSVCRNTPVTFTDLSQSDGRDSILQWTWSFGDGPADTLSGPPFRHLYSRGGQYTVMLTVWDQAGCAASASRVNYINVDNLSANFFASDTLVCPGATVNFINGSTGNGLSYMWDFGDSTGSMLANPNKTYGTDGAYSVKLTATSSQGCKDSLLRTAYIRVATPKASFSYRSNGASCPPFVVTLTNTSVNYRSIFWDFGDGSTSTLDTPKHVYNIPGNYTIRLMVTGYSGCEDSALKSITVSGPSGTQQYQPRSGCIPLNVGFSAVARNTVKYSWDFGDGVISTPSGADTVSHNYTVTGTYHPRLIVEDAEGCKVTIPNSDSIVVDHIQSKFTTDYSQVCDSNNVQFLNQSPGYSRDTLGMPAAWHWDFGDPLSPAGDSSGLSGPRHQFSGPGHYRVILRAVSAYGCTSYDSATVNIPGPFLMSAAGDTTICAGQAAQLSAAGAARFNWIPPTGLSNPAIANPVARPDSSTAYIVLGSDSLGCYTDTGRVSVTVVPAPRVNAGENQTVTVGSTVQLQAKGSSDVTSWQWSPPDYLSCTNCADPVSNPRRPITYTVVAANANGCVSIAQVAINLVCSQGVVFIPNTFTPNGDGINDILYPRGRGIRTIHYFRIYNRWGQLMFERDNFNIDDKSFGWDGTFKGKKLTPDVYVYVAELVCDTGEIFQLKGNITLLR